MGKTGKVVAIDGPSGAGKSTIARLVAERLGFKYLDTGALYRAVALLFVRHGIKAEDADGVLKKLLDSSTLRFEAGNIILNDEDVSSEIRTPEVGHYSSVFSAKGVVRDFLLGIQRKASLEADLVVEGRDTTTVIFPGAWKKFYVDASIEERARRRYGQLKELGFTVTDEAAGHDVSERDKRDSARDLAPLKRATDAVLIDTTNRTIEDAVEYIMRVITDNTKVKSGF